MEMGRGEREGEFGIVNDNGAPVLVANGGGMGGRVEKVKFTVSVRGYQWSSARHANETLQEFTTAIQVFE